MEQSTSEYFRRVSRRISEARRSYHGYYNTSNLRAATACDHERGLCEWGRPSDHAYGFTITTANIPTTEKFSFEPALRYEPALVPTPFGGNVEDIIDKINAVAPATPAIEMEKTKQGDVTIYRPVQHPYIEFCYRGDKRTQEITVNYKDIHDGKWKLAAVLTNHHMDQIIGLLHAIRCGEEG